MSAPSTIASQSTEQFVDAQQRRQADAMGIWLFLSTEVLFFGGLFLVYFAYRIWYPSDFAVASRHLDIILGTINTAILLTSSFFIASAISAAQLQQRGMTILLLVLTVALGCMFLGIKGYEWYDAAHEGFWPGKLGIESTDQPNGVKLFFTLYYAMTGLHGFHMIIGIGLVSGLAIYCRTLRRFEPNMNMLRTIGLYWHFVDVVWIFLFPLLYFIGRAH